MNLIEFIHSDKDVRTIFGRRELEIIEKQIMGVRLRPSERTRLSRDIRRKLEAVRKLAKFEEDFRLKRGSRIRNIVNETCEVILNSKWFPRVRRIIIYGSTIKGDATFRSDIDIAVDIQGSNLTDATLFRKEISGRINERVDLQVLSSLPEKIKKEIKLCHKVVYEKANTRQDRRDRNP